MTYFLERGKDIWYGTQLSISWTIYFLALSIIFHKEYVQKWSSGLQASFPLISSDISWRVRPKVLFGSPGPLLGVIEGYSIRNTAKLAGPTALFIFPGFVPSDFHGYSNTNTARSPLQISKDIWQGILPKVFVDTSKSASWSFEIMFNKEYCPTSCWYLMPYFLELGKDTW